MPREQFDWVVVDTPPVAMLPDANLLAAMIDTALLVVQRARRRRTRWCSARSQAIGTHRILGVVLNRAGQGRHGRRLQLLRLRRIRLRPRQDRAAAMFWVAEGRRNASEAEAAAGDVHENWRPFVLSPARRACWSAPSSSAATCVSAPTAWELLDRQRRLLRVLLIVGVCQLVPALRGSLRPARRRPASRSASRGCMRGARRDVADSRRHLLPVPAWIVGRGVFLLAAVFMVTLVVAWRIGVRVADAARRRRASGCCWSAPVPRRSSWRASCSSGGRSSASTSSASSIPIPRASARR